MQTITLQRCSRESNEHPGIIWGKCSREERGKERASYSGCKSESPSRSSGFTEGRGTERK